MLKLLLRPMFRVDESLIDGSGSPPLIAMSSIRDLADRVAMAARKNPALPAGRVGYTTDGKALAILYLHFMRGLLGGAVVIIWTDRQERILDVSIRAQSRVAGAVPWVFGALAMVAAIPTLGPMLPPDWPVKLRILTFVCVGATIGGGLGGLLTRLVTGPSSRKLTTNLEEVVRGVVQGSADGNSLAPGSDS